MNYSLIIPCYNEATNLPALVSALQAMPLEGLEIVLVDNGSTDGTSVTLARLIEPFPFMRSIRIDENKGYGLGILSGLRAASNDILAWTHADLQTDPRDVAAGIRRFREAKEPERMFVKGKRFGRPLRDNAFTWAMSAFEWLSLGERMWDINAQPTMFHRRFFDSWADPPEDAALDLYAYFLATQSGLTIHRFPVYFGRRLSGDGQNESLSQKIGASRRTMAYSLELRRKVRSGEIA